MTPMVLLAFYGLALFVSSLLGGTLPQRVQMTHTRTQLAMSLVSGLMLGIAFFHLLPHAVITLGGNDGLNAAMGWLILGLVVMLLLLRLLHFHQPDLPAGGHDCDHDHEHGHQLDHQFERQYEKSAAQVAPQPGDVSPASWQGVLIGLTFHTFIDGVALGAAFLAAPHGHGEELLGFGVFLAILLHKPLDAMSIVALMRGADTSQAAQRRANLLFAIVCPVGAGLFYAGVAMAGSSATVFIGPALAFSAGAFVCIALADLLPEVQFHSHDRVKFTAVFLLGIGVSYLLATGHADHSHALTGLQVVSGG